MPVQWTCPCLLPRITDSIITEFNDYMDNWKLKDCYLVSDMERLDNPQLFQLNFRCEELDEFLTQIHDLPDILKNKRNINYFFERLLECRAPGKILYLRLKWVVYLHSLMSKLDHENGLFRFIHKAIHMYLERLPTIQDKIGRYESYLTERLLRPYLQYLNKLCALHITQFEEAGIQNQEQAKTMAWYKSYNFVIWALSTLEQPIKETNNFFSVQFPYLNNLSWLIYSDLKAMIGSLRQLYKTMNRSLQVTVIEMDKLTTQINQFSDPNDSLVFRHGMGESIVEDLSKEDITEFFISPEKNRVEHMTEASSLNTQSPELD